MIIWWLSYHMGSVICGIWENHMMIIWWSSTDYLLIIWWSSNYYLIIICSLLIVICWLFVDHLLIIWWLSYDHQKLILMLIFDDNPEHMKIFWSICSLIHDILRWWNWERKKRVLPGIKDAKWHTPHVIKDYLCWRTIGCAC